MTESVAVDTDVFSFLFKGDTRGRAYAREVAGKRVCVSFMTVAELTRWAISHNWGASRRESLTASLQKCVVLPYDSAMADHWARIAVERARAGRPIACGDCWIAASALRFGIPLITHNADDYASITSLKVITRA